MKKRFVSVLCVVALFFMYSVPVFAVTVDLIASRNGFTLTSGSRMSLFLDSTDSYVMPYDKDGKNYASSRLVYTGVAHYIITGFIGNSTYTGGLFLDMSLPTMAQGSVFFASFGDLSLPLSLTHDGVVLNFRGLPSVIQAGSVSACLPDGTVIPVQYTSPGTIFLRLDDVYIDSGFSLLSVDVVYYAYVYFTQSYTGSATASYSCPLMYSFDLGYQDCYFSGTRVTGKLDSADLTADLVNKKADEIAAAQASQSAQEHEDTVNGYDDSAGQAVNDNLQQGISVYESQEDQAHQDFNDKMDAYEDPDISDYVSGVSFISTAVVMWWNALGMFKIILLVGFSLMIFNYISRFRGG